MPMPDTTELTLFGIAAAVMLVLLASWPIQWWLARRSALADDDEQVDALAESPTLMEAVRSTPDPPPCGMVWRDEVGCYRFGPHGCALIGGHRTHRCVCGSYVTRERLAFDPDDVYGLPEDRPTIDARCGDCTRGCVGLVCPAAEPDLIPPPLPPLEQDPVAIRLGIVPDPYTTDGTVKLGRNTLCRVCVDHRTNGRYADICEACRPSLVGSASKLPPS